MQVYLFGYADGDFLMRVIVTPDERTVAQLGAQLLAWSLVPERGGEYGDQREMTVRNERGDVLVPTSTLAEAGLGAGDIFTVERS